MKFLFFTILFLSSLASGETKNGASTPAKPKGTAFDRLMPFKMVPPGERTEAPIDIPLPPLDPIRPKEKRNPAPQNTPPPALSEGEKYFERMREVFGDRGKLLEMGIQAGEKREGAVNAIQSYLKSEKDELNRTKALLMLVALTSTEDVIQLLEKNLYTAKDPKIRSLIIEHLSERTFGLSGKTVEFILFEKDGRFSQQEKELALAGTADRKLSTDTIDAVIRFLNERPFPVSQDLRQKLLLRLNTQAQQIEDSPEQRGTLLKVSDRVMEELLGLGITQLNKDGDTGPLVSTMKAFKKSDHPAFRQPAFLEKLGKKLAQTLLDNQEKREIIEPLKVLYEPRKEVPPELKSFLEKGFKDGFLGTEKPNTREAACEAACDLAGKVADWSKKEFFETPQYWEVNNESSWHYANASLGALFLAKAAPFCPAAKDSLAKYADLLPKLKDVAALGNETKTPPSSSQEKPLATMLAEIGPAISPESKRLLEEFAKKAELDNPSSKKMTSPLNSYGNMFYSLFLDELKANPTLQPLVKNLAKPSEGEMAGSAANVHLNQANAIQGSGSEGNKPNGSLWHTFLMSTSLITTNNTGTEVSQIRAKQLRKTRDAAPTSCNVPYYINPQLMENSSAEIPKSTKTPTEDEIASDTPRSVTANLALYLNSKKEGGTLHDQDRYKLLESLNCFLQHGWKSAVQSMSSVFHSNDYAQLGSHYFYPNIPYIAEAIRQLKSDGAVPAEYAKVYEDELNRLATSMKGDNGLARRMGSGKQDFHSKGFVNPLKGLALVPSCVRSGNSFSAVMAREDGALGIPRGDQKQFEYFPRPTHQLQVIGSGRTRTEPFEIPVNELRNRSKYQTDEKR